MQIAQLLDIMTNIPSESINFDNLKATCPTPELRILGAAFLVQQLNDKLTILRHYILKNKFSLAHLVQLCRGQCHEITWGSGGKHPERKPCQWMLEQMEGSQLCRLCLSTEKTRPASSRPSLLEEQQEEGWTFIQKDGEFEKSELK